MQAELVNSRAINLRKHTTCKPIVFNIQVTSNLHTSHLHYVQNPLSIQIAHNMLVWNMLRGYETTMT